ncbi:MAG: isoleucine--tRNA ligase [Candidatus Diapherotrites archaeon]
MKSKTLQPYSKTAEDEVHAFWKKNKIPEKTRAQNAKSKQKFYFVDGPPYANAHIHLGTGLNKVLKDVAMRSQRMQGKNVFDRPGYDSHGTPIESMVEKELGFQSKKDIESFGVGKFVEKCRTYATQHIEFMNQEFKDLGVWMDWKNPYITLQNEYIEAIWYAFKKADEKGFLYLGKYPVHVCPHCGTAVSYSEIEYTKQTDNAVFVKLKVKGKENTFLIVWTTTPWTLPGNTGVMVHPSIEYSEIALSNGEHWIVAKEKAQELMNAVEGAYSEVRSFAGKELEGTEYEAPLDGIAIEWEKIPNAEKKYRVILSERYVDLSAGTGLVHCAPGHGKEDFDAGNRAGLPIISPIEMDGSMGAEAGKYAGKKAREVDAEIVEDLKKKNALVFQHPYSHDYPICWRCNNPLLMMSVPQWFLQISRIKERMQELSAQSYWIPEWMKARMKDWIENLADWPVSRARYWGTPLPIWLCSTCGAREVIGSLKELNEKAKLVKDFDLHKPGIDAVEWKCACGGTMKRVPEVLDVWFDSGVASWANLHFPAREDLFKQFWPGDLNIEMTEQVRGWWNSQLILGTICFDQIPFKAVAVHGKVLDLDKNKMSKSRGNVVAPKEVIEKYNRDFLRYYLIEQGNGEDFAFDWKKVEEVSRFFSILWNTYNFGALYCKMSAKAAEKGIVKGKLEVEDQWILSRLAQLVQDVEQNFDAYTFSKALPLIENFVLEDLSRTYIKLVRERSDSKAVSQVLGVTLMNLLKLLAPTSPHFTEFVYQHWKGKGMKESIHLLQLPQANVKNVDAELEKEFDTFKELAQSALSLREEQKLRLRWPLKELIVVSKSGKELKRVLPLLERQANVKKCKEVLKAPQGNFAAKEAGAFALYLNVEANEELKDEWEFEELRRRVQDLRKQAKLIPGKKAILQIACSDAKFLKKFGKKLEKETDTKLKLSKGPLQKLVGREFFLRV